ncbi:MAG: DUF433 domain-containing protein [Blastocatellia bacterium]
MMRVPEENTIMRKSMPDTSLNLTEDPCYIEMRDGGYYVKGSAITLESVLHQFLGGLSPETIQRECFPALTLEQVYGVLAYYLRHQARVDEYLVEAQALAGELIRHLQQTNPRLIRTAADFRRHVR